MLKTRNNRDGLKTRLTKCKLLTMTAPIRMWDQSLNESEKTQQKLPATITDSPKLYHYFKSRRIKYKVIAGKFFQKAYR